MPYTCADCGGPAARKETIRCRPCSAKYRRETRAVDRFPLCAGGCGNRVVRPHAARCKDCENVRRREQRKGPRLCEVCGVAAAERGRCWRCWRKAADAAELAKFRAVPLKRPRPVWADRPPPAQCPKCRASWPVVWWFKEFGCCIYCGWGQGRRRSIRLEALIT